MQFPRSALIVATVACGALCGALLAFPWAARFAPAAPLMLFPLLLAYRTRSRAACAYLTVLFTAAMLLVGLQWIYAGAAAHQGAGDYYTSALALLFECIPYALAGLVASYFAELPAPQWCIAIAALWTLCEYWRATSGFGVPYVQLGHALIDTPLVWLSRIGGTELLTFACAIVAAALFELSRRAGRVRSAAWVLLGAVLAGSAMAYRAPHTIAGPAARQAPAVAVFQLGPVDDTTFSQYLSALQTLPPGSDLAVWPESNVDLSHGGAMDAIRRVVRMRRIPLLVGGSVADASGLHDALVYVAGDGNVVGYYAKRHLVPFGEYLPLPKLGHVLIPPSIVAALPNLTPGHDPSVFAIDGLRVGALICYESAFPRLARDDVRAGANVLVAATNDAWFATASGLWELGQTARLVTIETGTPMVLSGTVGPSGVIDADGRWIGTIPVGLQSRAVFSTPRARTTAYDATGDAPWLLAIATLGALAFALRNLRVTVPAQRSTARDFS